MADVSEIDRDAARQATEERRAGPDQNRRTQLVGGLLDPNASWRKDIKRGRGLPVLVELNLRHRGKAEGAQAAFRALCARAWVRLAYESVGAAFYRMRLTEDEIARLLREDGAMIREEQAVYRLWPDYPVRSCIDASLATVKGDAAQRAFAADGRGIAWAVVDSGIEASHPHFAAHHNVDVTSPLHRDFTGSAGGPLTDEFGHGTHIAGIIAGAFAPKDGTAPHISERVRVGATSQGKLQERKLAPDSALTAMAPKARLVSLKVLDATGHGDSSRVIEALQHVRASLENTNRSNAIHGINLSLGYEFEAEWFACGQSPLCVEVDKCVRAGLVVVASAGNSGYGSLAAAAGQTHSGMAVTINDPGNAELAITVGSTHRDHPHTYGISYFSSKGPTGDGRLKPDMVAPGERITSCAAGKSLASVGGVAGEAYYVDQSGTSQAAAHVSGVIAAFLSIRGEYLGQPEEVKRIFLAAAMPLGRERYFEGRGMVDLMRAIQSV